MVVNPEEKNNIVHRSVIFTVIWSFEYLIISILNDQIYYFVPTKTTYADYYAFLFRLNKRYEDIKEGF